MSEKMSQNEIDALMQRGKVATMPDSGGGASLSEREVDTLGEVGNISMGAAATALYAILGRKVRITTPSVELTTVEQLAEAQEIPYVVVYVEYTEGFSGNSLYILRVNDVKAITDIMMGGEGKVSEEDLSKLHISAISEAMNQMMGGTATSLADMFDRVVNISPPHLMVVQLADQQFLDLMSSAEGYYIQISFKMEIEGLADSSIMQLIELDFGRQLVDGMHPSRLQDSVPIHEKPIASAASSFVPEPEVPRQSTPSQVRVRPIQLSSFDESPADADSYERSIDIILDVPMQITVELGRCRKTIQEVMEMSAGSVIPLDRVAGEPVDVVVNGKSIARGEVIDIDDNYGIRVTEVLTTSRIRSMKA